MAYSPYRDASASLLDVRHYNYQRDPQFMESERVPNISAEGMPSEADIARNRGVPPIAIPYMTLHNLDRPDGKGKRIIVPMVVGFESTFLANSLQGLLCLPGCESVFMGEPVQAGSGSRRPHGQQPQLGEDEEHNCSAAGQRRGEAMMDTNEEETGGVSMDEADTQSANSSSHQPRPAAKQEKSSGSPPRSNASSRSPSSGAGSDLNSLGPSGDADGMANEEGGARAGRGDGAAEGRAAAGQGGDSNNNRSGGGDGASASAGRVLRGGIRCHGNIRVKSAVSRAYADFVLQHLEDGEINLKTPAPRCTSTRAVTDTQLDDAGELETLRGQTPNVPRCLAPVAIPGEAPAPAGTAADKGRVAGGEAAVPSATVLVSSVVPPMQRAASVTAAGVFAPDSATAASLPPAQSIAVSTGSKEQRWVLPSASEHSCSDYSPTPSSNDDDGGEGRGNSQSGEERDKTAALTASAAAAAAAGAAETRVGMRAGAEDSRRFTCFASNSIVNMPVYRFPRLESDDLAELTAFMVVRSSVQPDEAVDLDLATHVLGNPHDIERLPVELRMIMVNRAARLMKSAVFLQV